MRKRRILQTLPVFIIAFFFILYITIQLRAHGVNINKIDALHNKPSPNLVQRSIQEVYYGAEKDAPSESDFTQQPFGDEAHKEIFTRNNRTSQKAHNVTPSSALKLTDLFIAVKTTGRFHRTRLALLLDTWISRTKEHTFIFTDTDDPGVSSRGYNMVVTDCQSDHSQQALSCKMSAEYDHFMASDKRWLCHVDDDNYVNPTALLSLLSTFPANGDIYVGKPSLDRPITAHELLEGNDTREVHFWFATGGAGFCLSRRLAQRMAPWASGPRFEQTSAAIRLPDDCTVGFIVEKRLGVSLVHCPLFHSHLENLLLISPSNVAAQVTLSYGMFENKLNSIEMKGIFSKEEDPSRFKTVHCMLYPFTSWCP